MTLQTSLLRQLDNPKLSRDQRAELRCQLAKEREEHGDYEGARHALGELWQRVGERPKIEKLERNTAAEVLLRVGVLTGWIGSKQQIAGTQELAKNLACLYVLSMALNNRRHPAPSYAQQSRPASRQALIDLVAVRDAIRALETGDVNNFFLNGKTYTAGELEELRRLERRLASEARQSSA